MKTYLLSIDKWLSSTPKHTTGIRVLQVCIGLMLCFRIGTEIPFAKYLWGPAGIHTNENSRNYFGNTIGGFSDTLFFSDMKGLYTLLFILFTGAIFLILNIQTRLAALLCAFSFVMLESRLPAISDGGDNIMRLTLVYMVFLISHPERSNQMKIKIWLHNLAVAAIILQLMILYETSGFMKAAGEKWQNGTAMYVVSNVEWFSLPQASKIFADPYLCTITTYVPMFFMLFFPIAIFSRFKLVWLFIGICMHLGIAYTMGLIVFSSVMIGLELFLITDQEYANIKVAFLNSSFYQRLSGLKKATVPVINLKKSYHE